MFIFRSLQAAESVKIMNVELAEKKLVVDERQRDIELLINDINDKSQKANKRREEARNTAEQISKVRIRLSEFGDFETSVLLCTVTKHI